MVQLLSILVFRNRTLFQIKDLRHPDDTNLLYALLLMMSIFCNECRIRILYVK